MTKPVAVKRQFLGHILQRVEEHGEQHLRDLPPDDVLGEPDWREVGFTAFWGTSARGAAVAPQRWLRACRQFSRHKPGTCRRNATHPEHDATQRDALHTDATQRTVRAQVEKCSALETHTLLRQYSSLRMSVRASHRSGRQRTDALRRIALRMNRNQLVQVRGICVCVR